jgi:hypothetical protein
VIRQGGLDRQEWGILAIDGKRSWAGYSFVEGKAIDLESSAWLPSGEFSATAACRSDIETKWKGKLIKGKGQWGWKPLKNCVTR